MLKWGSIARGSFAVLLSLLLTLLATPGFAADNGNEVSALFEPVVDDGIDVLEGRLVKLTHNALQLDVEGRIKTFYLTDKSTFWRGGETDASSFQLDDSVMVRFNKGNFVVERAWANLTRVQGWIKYDLDNGYRILATRTEKPEIDLLVDKQRTAFENVVSHSKEWVGTRLPEGTFVDVIGLKLGDTSVLGTLVFYQEPTSAGAIREPSLEKANPPSPLATYTYTGTATWFDCPTGAGRCGTCSTSRSDQAAWPAMDSGCSGCTWTCCNCSKGCKNQVYLSCGHSVSVYDICGNKTRTVYIASCGPNQIALCGKVCGYPDCKGYATPIIDLTKPTFARFYDPAYRGCFSCKVTVVK